MNQDKADLTEDDFVLGYYYLRNLRPIIDRQTWQKRERRRTSSFSRIYKSYSFLLDLHLVRVLFRVLKTSMYPLGNERQMLLYKLHKVLANASALPNHPFPERIPTATVQTRDLFSPHKFLSADGISNS
ncbi:hypothetical protein [Fibrella forsythiae]|uniref:Transposase DDE domain-containing protein n=1 Tax=Fibrella forsythiae TaxID=2817061 RepID=A0ABS3JMD5_9BACT|nr:hypothetical protein [Fibrella forsythiae]MBO0951170.1 hypothetical protein [Fibrella forsythiae]